MTKFKHTKGPWKVENDFDITYENRLVATTGMADTFEEAEKYLMVSKADAQLISCSPAMLDALIEARQWIYEMTRGSRYECEGDDNEFIVLLDSVIESATGMTIDEAIKAREDD